MHARGRYIDIPKLKKPKVIIKIKLNEYLLR